MDIEDAALGLLSLGGGVGFPARLLAPLIFPVDGFLEVAAGEDLVLLYLGDLLRLHCIRQSSQELRVAVALLQERKSFKENSKVFLIASPLLEKLDLALGECPCAESLEHVNGLEVREGRDRKREHVDRILPKAKLRVFIEGSLGRDDQ